MGNKNNKPINLEEPNPNNFVKKAINTFVLEQTQLVELTEKIIKTISPVQANEYKRQHYFEIIDASLDANLLSGLIRSEYQFPDNNYLFTIKQDGYNMNLTCDCINRTNKICLHLQFVLNKLLEDHLLQIPFNSIERNKLLAKKVHELGWKITNDLDDLFSLTLTYGRLNYHAKKKLLPYTKQDKLSLQDKLLPKFILPEDRSISYKNFVLIKESDYKEELVFELMEAPLTKSGAIKTPIEKVEIHNRLRHVQNKEENNFYIALIASAVNATIEDYRDIVKNPLQLDFYLVKLDYYADKIAPKKLSPIQINGAKPEIEINVKESNEFYVLSCKIKIGRHTITSKDISLYMNLLIYNKTLFALNNISEYNVLAFFKKNEHEIYLHQEQFKSFKEEFLDKLENVVQINYSFIKPASKAIKNKSLETISKHVIYLTESGEFILITPVLTYGDVEIPVLSKQTVYLTAPDGTIYSSERDEVLEHRFIRNIQAQHPNFEKIPQTEFYYLHKKHFLTDDWFIQAFQAWRSTGYNILGFNNLKNNRYNEHNITVRTSVQSGIDWFDIHAEISYGAQKVSLKQIQKSILNKSRFIELGDGTVGILPKEWIEKFDQYLRTGDIKENAIRTHKSNFQLIDQLFTAEILSNDAQIEIQQYKDKLANFQAINKVKVPEKLNATLREYQKEGLNWLNFLDEFGFGGCLADDMGLGKTIQIIAYFLAQHEKGNMQVNLVIVPTTLLFNWQQELDKYAPHLKYMVHYGGKRNINQINPNDYHILLTTYGTMLSDINFLKELLFNIIVLDESQAIKNPSSLRYKAARLLQARQRLVLTGTPLENNTFDLYAQMSFVLPSLLGTAKRFADNYSTPIDRFQDKKRAQELQQKIHPFLLRRTKKQVAKELPAKTEIVLYCEMGAEQRKVYETYKNEFKKYLSGISEDELHSSNLHILQGLTKLRQLCNSPALLSDDEFYGDQSAKIDELFKQIEKLQSTHKILIFSQFVGMLELIKTRIEQENIGYAYLNGKTKNREAQVTKFQEDEHVRLFLISLKAGGTGLNLTEAAYVIIVDPWWNPAVENQAIARAYRIGQKNKVIAIRLITPNSIEEKIMELQERKRHLADELIQTDSNIFKQLKKNDLLNLL